MNKKQRIYSEQLRSHILNRVHLPEAELFRMKIDALSTYHYFDPNNETYQKMREKAKKYPLKQKIKWLKHYVKEYNLFLEQGFLPHCQDKRK